MKHVHHALDLYRRRVRQLTHDRCNVIPVRSTELLAAGRACGA
jgi:hypothetical protein